jgi:hypothetical protein
MPQRGVLDADVLAAYHRLVSTSSHVTWWSEVDSLLGKPLLVAKFELSPIVGASRQESADRKSEPDRLITSELR